MTKPTISQADAEAAVRTLIEWAGDDPDREGLLDTPARVARSYKELFAGYEEEPRAYLDFFLPLVGSNRSVPDPLPPALQAGALAALAERPPHEAEIPLDALAEAPFPKLVVSGAHSAAFDAVCDVLERRLPAERAVVPGAGHAIPRAPGYTQLLLEFLESAS